MKKKERETSQTTWSSSQRTRGTKDECEIRRPDYSNEDCQMFSSQEKSNRLDSTESKYIIEENFVK